MSLATGRPSEGVAVVQAGEDEANDQLDEDIKSQLESAGGRAKVPVVLTVYLSSFVTSAKVSLVTTPLSVRTKTSFSRHTRSSSV